MAMKAFSLTISSAPDGYTIELPTNHAVAHIEYGEDWWVMQVFKAETQDGPGSLAFTSNVTKLPEGSLDWGVVMETLMKMPVL